MKKRIKILDITNQTKTSQHGFGLIEILVTASIVAVSFIGFMTFILFSRDQTLKAQRKTEAVSLAEEAIEIVRKLRDDSYASNIATKVLGTTYYPVISGSPAAWTLTTSVPGSTNGYTTSIVFTSVNRDTNFNIAEAGTIDPDTKKVTATVTYQDSGTKQVKITTYITDMKDN